MNDFDSPRSAVAEAVAIALREDLGILGDITSVAVIAEDSFAIAKFVSRDEGVLAGSACVTETFLQVDPTVRVQWAVADGYSIEAGQVLATVEGSTRSILAGERVALNLVCHLSGVATLTRSYVRAAHGDARILDTRKTIPGLRSLQKAAVRAGGGFNHRESLSDAVLLKDNHLAVVGITVAVARSKSRWPGRMIEVECESFEQVIEAVDAEVDRIMLDNMTPDEVRKAVAHIDGRATIEVSGQLSLATVGEYAAAGVDFISIGALTHSVKVFDIGLDMD